MIQKRRLKLLEVSAFLNPAYGEELLNTVAGLEGKLIGLLALIGALDKIRFGVLVETCSSNICIQGWVLIWSRLGRLAGFI